MNTFGSYFVLPTAESDGFDIVHRFDESSAESWKMSQSNQCEDFPESEPKEEHPFSINSLLVNGKGQFRLINSRSCISVSIYIAIAPYLSGYHPSISSTFSRAAY